MTPRPAFVALAAVGRLLADARPLGKLRTSNTQLSAYLFRASPDGAACEVMVAWTASQRASLELPVIPSEVYDLLGREISQTNATVTVATAPVFVILPENTASELSLQLPPQAAAVREAKPCPVVLQALWPKERVALQRSAYRIVSHRRETVPIYAYNFGTNRVAGGFRITAPQGWNVTFPEQLVIDPGARIRLELTIDDIGRVVREAVSQLRIQGDFQEAGESILALRIQPDITPASPRMIIKRSGDRVTLTWTTSVAGFVLESSTDLHDARWSTVPDSPQKSGPTTYSVTQLLGNTAFYRLRLN